MEVLNFLENFHFFENEDFLCFSICWLLLKVYSIMFKFFNSRFFWILLFLKMMLLNGCLMFKNSYNYLLYIYNDFCKISYFFNLKWNLQNRKFRTNSLTNTISIFLNISSYLIGLHVLIICFSSKRIYLVQLTFFKLWFKFVNYFYFSKWIVFPIVHMLRTFLNFIFYLFYFILN